MTFLMWASYDFLALLLALFSFDLTPPVIFGVVMSDFFGTVFDSS